MKYYLYISDAKVDMLFPQIPHDVKEKVSTQFGFDLKLLSASRRTETESEENRISRLEVVVEFIRQFGNIGSLDGFDEYVEDTMQMHTATFPDRDPIFVYFGGTEKAAEKRVSVGLWGALKHVIGATNINRSYQSSSLAREALWHLLRVKGLDADVREALPDEGDRFEALDKVARSWAGGNAGTGVNAFRLVPDAWYGLIMTANTDISFSSPPQRVEFMAKRLLAFDTGSVDSKRVAVLLATPLYVALSD